MRIFISLALLLGATVAPAQDADKLFADVRAALAARNLNGSAELLKNAENTLPNEAIPEYNRLGQLHNYSTQFWQAVWKGAATLRGTDELVVGSTRVAVVESRVNSIILRVAGQNKTYATDNMPTPLALKLASLALKVDAPENLVIVGSFLAVDAQGDRAKAAAYWKKAAEGGIDIAGLSPELANAKPAVSNADIPKMTPTIKRLLKSKGWKILKPTQPRASRIALGDAGANNDEGRLLLNAPADESVTVVYQKGFTANVFCQIIFDDLSGDEAFNFHVEATDPISVKLPTGSALVEFARQRGEVRCQLNGKPVDIGGETSRGVAYVGVTIPAGGKCTVAAFAVR